MNPYSINERESVNSVSPWAGGAQALAGAVNQNWPTRLGCQLARASQSPWKGPMELFDHTILLVEDDPNEVFLMERAFQKAQLANPLRVARDGQEAIDYLNHQGHFSDTARYPAPTLMLLDLKMPRKNGFEVLEWLRQQPGLKRLVVVVLSSSNLRDDVNRAFDLGTNSYVVKPGDFETLINFVKTLDRYWFETNRCPDLETDAFTGRDAPACQLRVE